MNPYPGYGMPPGYPPQHMALANESQNPQNSPYNYAASAAASAVNHADVTKQSFEYNRNVIPGLGLNFSHNGTLPQNGLPRPAQPNSQPTALPGANSGKSTGAGMNENQTAAQDLEEGELSEGELEDFYEPQEDDTDDLSPYDPAQPSVAILPGAYSAEQSKKDHITDGAQAKSGPYYAARERSGSYSPYLSPREMTSRQSVESQHSPQGEQAVVASFIPHTDRYQDDSQASGRDEELPQLPKQPNLPTSNVGTPALFVEAPNLDTIEQAKEKAREAIANLWPFKIGYRDYIAEGIDASLLHDLFTSLGFEIDESRASLHAIPQAETTSPEAPAPQTNSDSDIIQKESQALADGASPDEAQQSSSKTEERKDRIARLLAAKASKPAAPASKPQVEPAKPASKLTTSKSQSEKSKLLQQKMEALRKAREAQTKKTIETRDSSVVEHANNALGTPGSAAKDGQDRSGSSDEAVATTPHAPVAMVDADLQAGSSIPGLFLSSTPHSDSGKPAQKRPVASDFDHLSGSSKRPFGQKRDSRPFLIDVSDDEDDAEMEIDSPEHHPASLHRPSTPSGTQPSSRDAQPEHSYLNHIASPAALLTPPQGSSTGLPGRPDLESMNKKIEEMKRKIAEAEARKRAKQSRQSSTTPSQANGLSEVQSPAITPGIQPSNPVASSTPTNTSENLTQKYSTKELPPLHVAKRSQTKDQPREERRIRSRAASQRISLIETYRRQQLLKLEALRSQVANIEKEIENSRLEEERLKKEVSPTPEPEHEPESLVEADRFVQESNEQLPSSPEDPSPSTDAMETSASSSRNSTAQSPSPDAEPTTSVPGHEMDVDSTQIPEPEPQAPVEALDEAPKRGEDLEEQSCEDEVEAISEGSVPEKEAHVSLSLERDEIMPTAGGADIHDEASEDMSDDYEPPEAGSTTSMSHSSPAASASSPSDDKELPLDSKEQEESDNSPQAPTSTQTSSLREQEYATELARKVNVVDKLPTTDSSRPHPNPYETPLRYFRAFRFHPLYKESVRGGIRSLTYSNKIDVRKALCPDQQVGLECPRGNSCEFQHFESMPVTDSQIVTVLTEYGNFEGEQKQKYINGLRELLTDLRNRKVKDLDAISQGIIEFRAQFLEDKSRVLPLGSVSI